MSVLDLFRDKRLRLRLPDDQRHDHQRGTRRGPRRPGGVGLPQTHQRLDRRARRAPRRRARVEGDVRADHCRPPAPAGRRRRKHAPLRVSINTTVAHESLEALDQMVDVAGELGVDAIGLNHLMFCTPEEAAETVRHDRRRRCLGDRDVRDRRSGPRHRARAREGRGPRGEVPGEERAVRLPPEGPRSADRELLHAGREARRPLPLPVPARARVLLRQGLLLPVHPRRSRRSEHPVARRNLERRQARRRCASGSSRTACSPSAGAAARWSCRRYRSPNRSAPASPPRRAAPFR